MNRFLVLGVGNAQKDLIDYLSDHSEYYSIFSCSNVFNPAVADKIEKFGLVDITNKEQVLDFAQSNDIDLIYSVGSDVAMPTVAWVSEQLNKTTYIDYATAFSCNSKTSFRAKLEGVYGAIPFHTMEHPLDIGSLALPIIVKPSDSQGQRGVKLINSMSELETAYQAALSHSRSGKVIAEHYVNGNEISVNAFLSNGEVIFSLISDRLSWNHNGGGIIHKHLIPSHISLNAKSNVEKLVRSVCSALNIVNGPAYFQIKMDADEPKLIEVTPRLDGCHMWRLIKYATGIDLLDMTVKGLIGLPLSIFPYEIDKSWTLEFFCLPPNEVFHQDLFLANDNAAYVQFYYDDGDVVRKMNGFKEKCGYQIYSR